MDGYRGFRIWRSAWAVILGGILAAILLLAACAPAASPTESAADAQQNQGTQPARVYGETSAEEMEEPTEAPFYADEASALGAPMAGPGMPPSDELYAGGADAASAPVVEAQATGGPAASGSGEVVAAVPPQEQMVIKNGQMSLLVEDAGIAIDRVTLLASDAGGYVISSEVWFSGEYKYATITIAVPAEDFEATMSRLRDIALEVLSESASGQDVSAEYVDLESRLRNLEATRDRISGFLDDARTVEEALMINAQLADIEAQIEQVKGRMNYLAGRAAYSTIVVSLEEPQPTPTPSPTPTYTPTPTPTYTPTPTLTPTPWSPSGAVDSAVKAQTGLLRFVADAAIWLGIFVAPWAIVLGVIGFGFRAVRRWLNGGSRGGGSGTGTGSGSRTP